MANIEKINVEEMMMLVRAKSFEEVFKILNKAKQRISASAKQRC